MTDYSLYDINQSYSFNAAHGPFFTGEIPERPLSSKKIDFLGFSLNSPLGVPAGPLLNARWVELAGKLGFDLPVYKTIRSFAHPGHALPNILYVEPDSPSTAHLLEEIPSDPTQISITNSFGMPSQSPDFLLQDIAKANQCLQEGQLLIVSIVGTPGQGVSFADDFVRTAIFAKEAGAKVIEANFSCPNVGHAEGCLYTSPETVRAFASAIVKAIHPIPLTLKVGVFANESLMRQMFIAAARAGVRAICGINSVSMHVEDGQGKPALGASRPSSGICGAAIKPQALQFIQAAHQINQQERLDLTLMSCGGIMRPEHIDEFLQQGATIAMSATGMMWEPYLAFKWHRKIYEANLSHS
ncbi:MAG: tRNA-dihydrouridine synthase [Chlamydiales bacterium]|nr:tRNA-dihydrouridine synthase [Chlamydiales bacterium]